MKLKTLACLSVTTLFLSSLSFAATDTVTYKNARGSELKLHFSSDDTVTGTFTTAVASKKCQQVIGIPRPIVGYTAKNAIAFSVNYPDCGSVVSFSGNVENDKSLIDTTAIISHLSVQVAKEGPGLRMISHDVFTRIDG